MKKVFYLIFMLNFVILSCNSDDSDARTSYPKNADIEFAITSSDESRLSKIETLITNGVNNEGVSDLDISTSSYSNTHLPFKKEYINQTIKFSTTLLLSYTDNSEILVNENFQPYTIILNIFVNGENIASKELEIKSLGQVANIDFVFK